MPLDHSLNLPSLKKYQLKLYLDSLCLIHRFVDIHLNPDITLHLHKIVYIHLIPIEIVPLMFELLNYSLYKLSFIILLLISMNIIFYSLNTNSIIKTINCGFAWSNNFTYLSRTYPNHLGNWIKS